MSLQAVAGQLARPVTRAALSKYELGEVVPRADVLVDLGRVLGIPASYFLEPAAGEVTVSWLACRKHSRLPPRLRARVRARAAQLSEAYLQVLDRLEPGFCPSLPTPRPTRGREDAEAATSELRAAWGLGSGPIERLVQRTEDAGVLVLGWRDSNRLYALSGWLAEGWPVVVLNLDVPADRRRFELAHQLGHLLLETSSLETAEQERLASHFAEALLIPATAARRELGARRHQLTRAELEHLETKYGASLETWMRRARDVGILTGATYRRSQDWLRSQAAQVRETAEYLADEVPCRLRLLFVRALAERLVDRAWVQAICPEAVPEAEPTAPRGPRSLLREPYDVRCRVLEQAATEAAPDYENDPETEEFLAFHDEGPDD